MWQHQSDALLLGYASPGLHDCSVVNYSPAAAVLLRVWLGFGAANAHVGLVLSTECDVLQTTTSHIDWVLRPNCSEES